MYVVLLAIFVGAVIGALTNALAIKMLFRPFKAWMIGRWQVPFTPGLIPKRREEIAEHLGLLVENYLLTAIGMKKFLEESGIKEKLYERLKQKISEGQREKRFFGDILNSLIGEKWKEYIIEALEKKVENFKNNSSFLNKTLEGLLTEHAKEQIEEKLIQLAPIVLADTRNYLKSSEGKLWLQQMVKQFIEGKRMLGLLAGFLVEGESFQEKLLQYINQLLELPNTRENIENFLLKEWRKIKIRPIHELIKGLENTLYYEGRTWVEKSFDKVENIEINQIVVYLDKHHLLEKGYNAIIEMAISRLERVFPYLSISKVVREQVNQFSLAELEKMILEIVNKELKMITYLGGLLGGLIGLFQGLLYRFM